MQKFFPKKRKNNTKAIKRVLCEEARVFLSREKSKIGVKISPQKPGGYSAIITIDLSDAVNYNIV